ncbi:MAG: ABC transporter ATP-binding protein, partial [Gammaproteobacteria bacterium]
PLHPYTRGLLASMPRLDEARSETLNAIPGQPPNLQRLPKGCAFHPRCEYADDRCRAERPPLELIASDRARACFREEM